MFEKVTVAGSGTLGSQIAFQTAFKGFDVTVYDINAEVLEKAKKRAQDLKQRYLEEIEKAKTEYEKEAGAIRYNSNLLPDLQTLFAQNVQHSIKQVETTSDRLHFSSDLAQAVADADLVIEAVPEVIAIKTELYEQLGKVAPEKTIFATNTSTLVPSQFAEATGRPARFLALHFSNEIWHNNIAEVMGHAGTDPTVYDQVVAFAKQIGMVPIQVKKEVPEYVFNAMLGPLLDAAITLVADDIADPATVDRAWMLATGAPQGPLAFLDTIGMQTAYNANLNHLQTTGDPKYKKITDFLKNYIDQGKLGVSTGEGFYHYPHPAFEDPNFLRNIE